MADIDTQNPYRQAQFIGIDNRNPETKVRAGYVRDMENVVPTRDGQMPSRRDGYDAAFFTGGRVHSAWGDGVFPYALFVTDDTLHAVEDHGSAPLPLLGSMAPEQVSYAAVNSDVYFSNGTQSGMLTPDGELWPWACEAPAGQPSAAPVSGSGGMDAGTYQYAITFQDALGRESGTPRPGAVDVPAGGGFVLTSIPQPTDPSVTSIRLYISDANGEVLHHAHNAPPGVASINVAAGWRGRPLNTLFQEPLPPGQLVAGGHGRLFVARGRVVYWSDALHFGQGELRLNHHRFGQQDDVVTVLAAVGDGTGAAGVFVAAGRRTYWMAGADPADWQQVIAYPAGAVAGTLCWSSGDVWGLDTGQLVPSWLASNGQFVIGLPGGQVTAFNLDTHSTDVAEAGAAMIRDVAGQRQMVTTLRAPVSGAGLRDSVSVTVRRNGVLLP